MRKRLAEWTLLSAAGLAAASYFLVGELAPDARLALKALAVLPLALVAWLSRAPGGPLLAAALLAHATGDALLEAGPLLPALAAFGVGHGLYALLFAGARRPWEETDAAAKLRLGLLALAGAVVLFRIAPGLQGPLAVAVPGYALLLLTMAALAQVSDRGARWLAAGALLYVLSDSLLALDLFAGPLGAADGAIWPTYWAGQAAMTVGWLQPVPLAGTGAVG